MMYVCVLGMFVDLITIFQSWHEGQDFNLSPSFMLESKSRKPM